ARDKGHQTSLNQRRQVSRAHAIARQPANSRLFAPLQEISPKAGVRGGPGRTRTSNQTVISRPLQRLSFGRDRDRPPHHRPAILTSSMPLGAESRCACNGLEVCYLYAVCARKALAHAK